MQERLQKKPWLEEFGMILGISLAPGIWLIFTGQLFPLSP